MQKVPHKNIEPIILDIRDPNIDYPNRLKSRPLNLAHAPQQPRPHSPIARWISVGLGGLFVVAVVGGVLFGTFKFRSAKAGILSSGETIAKNFIASADALKDLNPAHAADYLRANTKELGTLRGFFKLTDRATVFDVLGSIFPQAHTADNLLSEIGQLNSNLLGLLNSVDQLKANGFNYFRTDGESLIGLLMHVDTKVGDVLGNVQVIKNDTSELKDVAGVLRGLDQTLGDYYLKHGTDLYETERFLAALTDFLGQDRDRHLLLLFQNPSEIRPAGGFLGSYADITVHRGQMVGLDVRDIYDPDGQLDTKVRPPLQLQTIVGNWGARDANWFFDYPTSARTVGSFLETSKIYSEKGVQFDAVIGINIRIVESILRVVGPIELPEYKLTIGADNFLAEVQREVEAGKDKKAGKPKKILQTLTPILLERLGALTPDARQQLFQALEAHLTKKDIQLYAKDSVLQHFFNLRNVDGSVFNLPTNFWGSYFAVVDANVAGGKSDAYMDQLSELHVDVDTNGGALVDATITRTHNGADAKDPWWKATNQNFIQVFSNPGTSLVSLGGVDTKKLVPSVDYDIEKYDVNPDVDAIEQTATFQPDWKAWVSQAFGKNVVGAWLNVPAGASKQLTLRYEIPAPGSFTLQEGSVYTVIFERQSGVRGAVHASVFAPLGYRWKETGTSIWNYTNDDPDGRVIQGLTLIR